MPGFVDPTEPRNQALLFPRLLDDEIPPDHPVRILDEILSQIDWSLWEANYAESGPGRKAFHPRLLAGIILYGLLCKVRASRGLEEALKMRIDFRWLAEGRFIDHTTLSEFRRKHAAELKDLFVQVVVIAQEAGFVSLSELAFDGTKMRANNHRQRTRTPSELRALQKELQEKFDEFQKQAEQLDQEQFASSKLPEKLADTQKRLKEIEKAMAEVDRLEAAGKEPPKRIPLTDPEARVGKNKEGGFAPNYNPVAGVETKAGVIIVENVLSDTSEEHELVDAVDKVEENFGEKPKEVLADGLFSTGENLAGLDECGVTLYSPVKGATKTNPAIRDDPSVPVPAEEFDALPKRCLNKKKKLYQLDKSAFMYDEENDCYYCPLGKKLEHKKKTSEKTDGGTRLHYDRYEADPKDCAECPLKGSCLGGKAKARSVKRDQFEPHRERHAKRMKTDEAKEKYAKRCAPGERPFGVIKQQFGARQFLLRGLQRVKVEWTWLTIAFNLKIIMGKLSQPCRAGPE